MTESLILFDWDDTLFSKAEYKKNLRSNLSRICGISEEEALKTEGEYFKSLEKSGDFQIENFVKTFEDKFGKKIELNDFETDKLKIYSKSLFPETIPVLEKLQTNFKLGIFTQGSTFLQKIKIKSSGIEEFFDKDLIFIAKDKLDPDFLKKIPNATVVDDKKEVVEKLATLDRFVVVLINRTNDEKITGIRNIKNLSEVEKVA